MNLYVLLNIGIIAAPLVLSFDRRVAFFRQWPSYAMSVLVVSTVYIIWDVLVTERGDWWFNPIYAGEPMLIGLPMGEVLFFVTVPYACLFIYEVVRAYFRERSPAWSRLVRPAAFVVSAVLIALAIGYRDQHYTPLALGSVAVFLILAGLTDRDMLGSSHTLLFFVLSYVPFLIVNGILTSLPVVGYSPNAIWGVRVFSIPLEDFFYNFAMLGFYLLVYRRAKTIVSRIRGATS